MKVLWHISAIVWGGLGLFALWKGQIDRAIYAELMAFFSSWRAEHV